MGIVRWRNPKSIDRHTPPRSNRGLPLVSGEKPPAVSARFEWLRGADSAVFQRGDESGPERPWYSLLVPVRG